MSTQPLGNAELNGFVAQRIVRCLLATGAQHAVISPGSRNTPIVVALAQAAERGQIQLHSVLDERQAGFVGLGLARRSGRPVLLSCTSGTAGAHYLPALAEANQLGLPLIAVTADRPDELQGRGAPQTMDQVELFGRHVVAELSLSVSEEWLQGDRLEESLWRVVHHTCSRRPCQVGPVHLNLRFRKPLWAPNLPRDVSSWDPPRGTELNYDVAHFSEAFARIASAKKGIVLAGPREISASGLAESAVLDFAQKAGWPVLAEPAAGLRGPGIVHGAEAFLRGPQAFGALRPDCILRIGRSPTANSVSDWMAGVVGQNTVLVEPTGRLLDGERLEPLVMKADPAWAFLHFRTQPQVTGWLEAWKNAERCALDCLRDPQGDGLWAGSLIPAIGSAMGPGDDLHVASSMCIRDLGSFARLGKNSPRVSANRGTNGIDGTLSTAVGQVRASGRPTTVLLGDSPLRVIVVDNGGGGIFDHLPIAENTAVFEPYFLTPHKADLAAIAGAHGLPVQAVSTLNALRSALSHFSPGVIHVQVDRVGDFARHQAYWQAVTAAMFRP
jgi:2-succinyl-5-enolpyruvyl-6-hydroxy-3-cyclohexene-1-carboxylate synthase